MSFTYEQYDVLHNFISPITGRILADFNYVLVGNKNGIAIPSPIIIDIRLDLIALRKRYNSLVQGDIIIGHPNNELPHAQVLFNLDNGYLYNTEGIVSTNTIIPIGDLPDLLYQNIWIGDITNRPVAMQRVGLENLPTFLSVNPLNNFGLYGLYTGQLSVTSPSQAAQPSTTQRIDMSNMPHLSKGKMWLGMINYIPPVITINATFPYVHVTGSLNWSPPSIPPGDGDAVPVEIGLNAGEFFTGDPSNNGQIIVTNKLPFSGLPNLTYQAIWRGDITNRPVEVFDLSSLETRMTNAETAILGLQSSIAQLGVLIGGLQTQIGLLDTALGLLTIEVQAIATTVGTMVVTVTGLGITVAALGLSVTAQKAQLDALAIRTLDQIPLAVADVNLNNHKIVNLANPTNPLDAVNLQTLTTAIGGTISSVTGTANQITANTVAGAVTLSLPAAVIITTSLTAGNLELTGNTLISTNTNGNITLNPNGTGNIDVNNHKIINLANPVNPLDAVNYQSMTALTNRTLDLIPLAAANVNINNHRLINVSDPVGVLDAVNLQTLTAAIGAGVINSVSGTANQITANTVSGAVTLSLPTTVINTSFKSNTLFGNSALLLLTPGVVTVTGTGRTVTNTGSQLGGSITLNTGTGITTAGTANPLISITIAGMASTAFCVVLSAGNQTAAGVPFYVTNSSTSIFTIRCTAILANSSTYVINYIIIGN